MENNKNAEMEKMRRQPDFLQALIDALPNPIFFRDADGVYLSCNAAFGKSVGLPKNKIIGKTVYEIAPKDLADVYHKTDLDLLEKGGAQAYENKVLYADGTKHDVIVNKSVFKDKNGKILGILGVITDITGRKAAERELRQQRNWFQTTLTSIGDAVIVSDASGNVAFMNPVAENLTGWKEKEAVGKFITEIMHIVNEFTREKVVNPVEVVLKKGKVVGLANHSILMTRDGREIPLDDSGAPIKDEEGKLAGVVLVFRDIIERKQAEEELKARAKELERMNKLMIGRELKMRELKKEIKGLKLKENLRKE